MAYIDLEQYYRLLFSLLHFQTWPMEMVENWTPNDRDIFVHMLSDEIEKAKTTQNQN